MQDACLMHTLDLHANGSDLAQTSCDGKGWPMEGRRCHVPAATPTQLLRAPSCYVKLVLVSFGLSVAALSYKSIDWSCEGRDMVSMKVVTLQNDCLRDRARHRSLRLTAADTQLVRHRKKFCSCEEVQKEIT